MRSRTGRASDDSDWCGILGDMTVTLPASLRRDDKAAQFLKVSALVHLHCTKVTNESTFEDCCTT